MICIILDRIDYLIDSHNKKGKVLVKFRFKHIGRSGFRGLPHSPARKLSPSIVLYPAMLNFTGLTLKRVINLGGNRSSGNGSKSVAYVEQARIKRLERERRRKTDRAAIAIHSAVVRYFDMIDAGARLHEAWSLGNLPENPQQQSVWLLRFRFLCVWTIPRFSLMADVAKDLARVSNYLGSLGQPLSQVDAKVTVDAISALFNRIGNVDEENEFLAAIRAAYLPLKLAKDANHQDFTEINTHIEKWLKFNSLIACKDLRLGYILLVFEGSRAVHPSYLAGFLAHTKFPRSRLITDAFDKSVALLDLAEHTTATRIRILDKYFSTRELDSKFAKKDYVTILRILHEPLTVVGTGDDLHSGLFRSGCADTIYHIRWDDQIAGIKSLYTPESVNELAKLMMDSDSPDIDALFANLFALYPPCKSFLCMHLSINPTIFRWLFNEVTTPGRNDRKSLALLPLIELYSFWLVISNDNELFSNEKLTRDEAVKFVDFLREICIESAFQYESFKHVRSQAIELLNALYQKDMRLGFMPENYWESHQLEINSPQFMLLAEQEEQQRLQENIDLHGMLESGEHSSDNDDEDLQSHADKWAFSSNPTSEVAGQMRVLQSMPFLIPFKDRAMVFQRLIQMEVEKSQGDSLQYHSNSQPVAEIRRESVLKDAFVSFHDAGPAFKRRIQVSFYNKQGGQEVGIDGGGITKEFLTSVVEEGFNPGNELHLFQQTLQNQLYPNPEFYCNRVVSQNDETNHHSAQYFRFMGNVVGKCLYENILIDVSFAPFFLEKWSHSSLKNGPNDLSSLDPQLSDNLWKLMQMLPEELDLLALTFLVNEVFNGKVFTFDIIPGGKSVKLTYENRFEYIHHVASFKLNTMLHDQSKYFLEGLYQIIHPSWLRMFEPKQLQILLSGGERDIDVHDWREETIYGGYFDDDPTVISFWEVVTEMTPDERRSLVKFVTSVGRAPLLGFGLLVPKFGIRNSGLDTSRLPTASTCINLLKLPDYKDKHLMREKLLYAINIGAGFDLS